MHATMECDSGDTILAFYSTTRSSIYRVGGGFASYRNNSKNNGLTCKTKCRNEMCRRCVCVRVSWHEVYNDLGLVVRRRVSWFAQRWYMGAGECNRPESRTRVPSCHGERGNGEAQRPTRVRKRARRGGRRFLRGPIYFVFGLCKPRMLCVVPCSASAFRTLRYVTVVRCGTL